MAITQDRLAHLLSDIQVHDIHYRRRYELVFEAMHVALELGINAGVKNDPNEPHWPLVFIDLPTGQVSWHVLEYQEDWDGHDTAEKYRRCQEYSHSVLIKAAIQCQAS
jgi:hypothetical protein